MPKWEDRESSLLRRLQAGEGTDADAEAATTAAASSSGMLDEEVVPGAGLVGISHGASGEGSVGSPTKAAAAVASPVARAPIVDLLGGDDDMTYGNGETPRHAFREPAAVHDTCISRHRQQASYCKHANTRRQRHGINKAPFPPATLHA